MAEESDVRTQSPELLNTAVEQIKQLVGVLTNGIDGTRVFVPAREDVDQDCRKVLESIESKTLAIRRRAELARAASLERAAAFEEWLMGAGSDLPVGDLEALRSIDREPSLKGKIRPGVEAFDSLRTRLHRTLIGTTQSLVEHLPDELAGVDRVRVRIRWRENPMSGLHGEICLPQRDPQRVIGRLRDMAEEAARWQGEFSEALSATVALRLLAGLRAGQVLLPRTEFCGASDPTGSTDLEVFRAAAKSPSPNAPSAPSDAHGRNPHLFDAQVALANQQPVIASIIDVVLRSPDFEPNQLTGLLRPICEVLGVNPQDVLVYFENLGYAYLQDSSAAGASVDREKQSERLEQLLKEIEAIGSPVQRGA